MVQPYSSGARWVVIESAFAAARHGCWTGWNETGYFWDAGAWGYDIGFHHGWMGDTWLWAHEAGHAYFSMTESQANDFADMCMGMT